MSKEKNDPALYRALCEPITIGELDDIMQGFFGEVYALRIKYRIRDVHVIAGITAVYEDGGEGDMLIDMHAGDELKVEAMLAQAFGRAQADRQERMARAVAAAPSVKAQKPRG